MKELIYRLCIQQTNDTKIQFFRYLFVGGFSAVINIGSLFLFKEFLHIYYLWANVCGFLLGLITNYILSKKLIFSAETKVNPIVEFITYTLVGVVGLGIDTVCIYIATSILGIYYLLSKLISTAIVFLWNFFGRKLLYVIIGKAKKMK